MEILFQVNTNRRLCVLNNASSRIVNLLQQVLTIEQYNPFATWKKYIKYCFFYKDKYFPIGMLERVVAFLKSTYPLQLEHIEVAGERKEIYLKCLQNLIQNNIPFVKTISENIKDIDIPIADKINPKYSLRQYQIDAIKSGILFQSGIMKIPTGGGKTLIASGIISNLGKKRNLVIIHGNDLIEQTYEKYKDYLENTGIKVGKYTAREYIEGEICISSVDTLYSRRDTLKDFLASFEFIILDECHHSSSKNWMKVLSLTKTPLIIGMSGTPFRKNDVNDFCLEAVTSSLIYDLPITDMQSLGHLAKAMLMWIDTSDCVLDEYIGFDWSVVKKKCIIENWKRTNKIISVIKELLDIEGGILVLVGNSVDYGEILHKHCVENKIQSVFVSGRDSVAYRKMVFDKFREKKIPVVISTTITDEGMDFPELGCVILAYGGKSFVKLIQRIGRGLRPKDNPLLVIDFYDINLHKYLQRHTLERKRIYEQEKIFEQVEFIK